MNGLETRIREYFTDPKHKKLSKALREELNSEGLKYCYYCETVKPLADYNRKGSGYRNQCRECQHGYHYANHERELARMRKYKADNAEAIAAQCKRYRELNPLQGRIRDGYRRAKKLGAPVEEFRAEDVYAYWREAGIDPWVSAYSGKPLTPDNYGLDHIIPLSAENTPGNVPWNLAPCTKDENRRKFNKKVLPFRLLALLALHEEEKKNEEADSQQSLHP
ncbi:HNH endonuclease domain-containing protein [Corynebacterium curieae]|uniref:HNH endonuclease domain-containing protein n=1 Tax=Corynebacterium curieae TaxID=2913500 RepID=A0ABU3W7W7_9CORY|nr:HNH endonuclease domain-containing protein [Corynebacterium curieae]MDV2424164.1 HNH endonuclease domain-containing protein [Corynebacterium curieae]